MENVSTMKAGWRPKEWCALTGIGLTSLYGLPSEAAPESVKIGAARVITESPAAWLARMRERQGTVLPEAA